MSVILYISVVFCSCWSTELNAKVDFGNKLYGFYFFSPCGESVAKIPFNVISEVSHMECLESA